VKTISTTNIRAHPTLKIRSESFKLIKTKTTPTSHSPTYQTKQTIIKAYTLKAMEERDLALQHGRDPTVTLSTKAQNARQIHLRVHQQQLPLYQ